MFRLKSLSPWRRGLVIALATWGVFFALIWPRVLRWSSGDVLAVAGVWGDWAAHATYASVFAYRPMSQWLVSHPLFEGRKFTYPFAADMISGVLVRVGLDEVSSLIVPSIVISLGLVVALYAWCFHFLKSVKQSLVAMTLYLLSGGLGFLWYFDDLKQSFNFEHILFPPREYTHMSEHSIEWITTIFSQLLPQRAFLLGLPLTLILLLAVDYLSKSKKQHHVGWIGLGALSSLMLFVHVHALIAFVMFCAAYAVVYRVKWQSWFLLAVSAAIPSAMLFSFLYGGEIGGSFFKWYPGWMANPDAHNIAWPYFWWLNWGVFGPFALFSIWRTRMWKHPIVLGGLLIFGAANLVLFQPYNWDNSKMLSFSYLAFSLPVARMLGRMWQVKIVGQVTVLALIFFMVLSGWLDVQRLFVTDRVSHVLWSKTEVEMARRFRAISDPASVVLASDAHNHWASNLTGRQVLLGYRGWMWTYGIGYSDRYLDMLKMYAGGPESEMLMHEYNVSYVVVGPYELSEYKANTEYFHERHPVVLQDDQYTVFQVR